MQIMIIVGMGYCFASEFFEAGKIYRLRKVMSLDSINVILQFWCTEPLIINACQVLKRLGGF